MCLKYKFFYYPLFFLLPLNLLSQIPVSISDIDLVSDSDLDNWSFQENVFFVVPVQFNDYIELQQMSFNLKYNPSIISLVDNNALVAINTEEYLNTQPVEDISLFSQGNISSEIYPISDQEEMLTVYFNTSEPISESDFDSQNGTLMYLAFKKEDPCYEGPVLLQFWNGLNKGTFINPDNTSAITMNLDFTTDNNMIFSIDGSVEFSIPMADIFINGSNVEATVNNGTHPFSYEWTDKLGLVLSTDSIFTPESSSDYFLNVIDANGCVSSVYFSFDIPTSISELRNSIVGPNPFSTSIIIEQIDAFEYVLYTLEGRIVRQGNAKNKILLDTQNLEKGVYFLRISSKYSDKIIKLISSK